MIALDTNVLVRFLTQDDPHQGRLASNVIGSITDAQPGFICREVLVELVWVLERSYGFSCADIAVFWRGCLRRRSFSLKTRMTWEPSLNSSR